MLNEPFVIARKELVDHLRDTRAIASSALYALMGPAVILLAMMAKSPAAASPQDQPWPIMAAVFALMAVFTGAMAPAMDMMAGERERRTLLPLIVSTFARPSVIVGKWIAASVFAAGGLLISVLAFALVFAVSSLPVAALAWLLAAPALLALALFAAAIEMFVSTMCRGTKEANTYLSMLIFAAMGIAMWLAFRPDAGHGWVTVVPLLGHQRLLQVAFAGGVASLVDGLIVVFQSSLLAIATLLSTAFVLAATSTLFQRDDAVYGG